MFSAVQSHYDNVAMVHKHVGVMTESFDVNSQGISYMLTHKVKLQFVCFLLFIGNERI